MTIDLEGMRAAAEKATPGPWTFWFPEDQSIRVAKWVDSELMDIARIVSPAKAQGNAAFIATANPAAVLAPLDYVERLKEGLQAIEFELSGMGHSTGNSMRALNQARSLIQETQDDR